MHSLQVALSHQIPPNEYFRLELFQQPDSAAFSDYFVQFDQWAVKLESRGHEQQVDDKLLFSQVLGSAGIAQPQLIEQNPLCLPSCDLVAKPRRGSAGRGVLRLTWSGQDRWSLPDGRSLDRDQLLDYLGTLTQEYLLQVALTPLDSLLDLSARAVPVVRVLSGHGPHGAFILQAQLSIPRLHNWLSQYGLWCRVDVKTGRISDAVLRVPGSPRFSSSPDTGAAIQGRVLPHWAEIQATVLAAHRLLSGHRLLGWDVALSQRGPVILEANRSWESALPQRLSGPLCSPEFLSLFY